MYENDLSLGIFQDFFLLSSSLQESDASSNSSDSDVDSVVEVTDLTMLRRPVTEAGYAYAPLATNEPVAPRSARVPGLLPPSSKRSRESLRNASGSPLLKKDTECVPRIINSNHCDGNKRNSRLDSTSPSPRAGGNSTPVSPRSSSESSRQETPSSAPKDSSTKTRKSYTPGETPCVEEPPAPPKPPRVFLPPDKQQPLKLSPSKTSPKAPLAEDEVDDAYCNGRRLNNRRPPSTTYPNDGGVQAWRPSDPGGVASVI